MSIFWFYSLQNDWFHLLDEITRRYSLQFAVDRRYVDDVYGTFDGVDSKVQYEILANRRNVFLTGLFSKWPLFLKKHSNDEGQFVYSVDLYRGGPWMRMCMSAQFEEDSILWLSPASLYIQDSYLDNNMKRYSAPVDLCKAFDACVATLQEHVRGRPVGKDIKWMSAEVMKLFQQGRAGVRVRGAAFTIDGERPLPSLWRR